MKQFEADFLRWAKDLMKNKLPISHAELIYNDLLSAFWEKNENIIKQKVSAFTKKMIFAYSRYGELSIRQEIFSKAEELNKNYNHLSERSDDDLIFKFEK